MCYKSASGRNILTNAQSYIPPKPVGTHKLGSLLDDECYRMIIKPRKGVKMADIGQWKAVIKNGEVVYVLCEKKT